MRLPCFSSTLVVMATGLLLVGCGTFEASKSGGGVAPVTLRLATADQQGRAATDLLVTFAREVETGSDGGIDVEILWESYLGDDAGDPIAANAYEGDPFGAVAGQLESGEVEIALVPDFVWAERGVEGVAALKVPFLIDSVELMKEIARHHGAESLAGLTAHDLVPLALLPESIRHPVGFDHPLVSLSSFDGHGIRVVDSSTPAVFEAWGARPVSLEGGFGRAVALGQVSGAESAFVQSATLPRSGVFTADVAHSAKFNTVVAARGWWDGLSSRHREIITAAADSALAHALATTPEDDVAGRRYCDSGGTVVHAGEESVAQLVTAAADVIDDVRGDPANGALIASIEELKSSLPPAAVAAACAPAPPPERAGDPVETAAFPEGTYRAELTVADFTDRGVDSGLAHNHDGVWTLTFRDGQVYDIDCSGTTYSVDEGRLSVVLGRADPGCGTIPGEELFSAAWAFDGRVLRFSDVASGGNGPALQTFTEVLWGSQDWVKID